MSNTLMVLTTGPGEPAWNMALDEALLLTAARRDRLTLRFYSWTRPAATFGYSQRHSEVSRLTLLRPLIRRPTGGGIVPHDRDWTYSLVVPPVHPWFQLRAWDSYRAMHTWVANAFARLEVPAELAPRARHDAPGQCFVGYEQFDVLWHGRKIAGAAQRRNRLGLLIQGSIQPPPGLQRADWEEAMRHAGPPDLVSLSHDAEPDPDSLSSAADLAASKYGRDDYNTRR